jgi:hypothetical protein
MSQTYRYPASASSVTISAIGTNGATNPATSIQIGGKSPSNTLLPLSVDGSGVLNVNVSTTPANQTVDLNKVGGAAITLGQKLMATSLPVALASDQSALAITVATLPLPSGAATETTLAAMSAKLPATIGQKAMSASLAVALASDQSSIPVAYVDPTASGAITTQNLNPNSGVATAGSTVAVTLTGQTTLAIQVTGVYTGALTVQGTIDGTNWVAVSSVMNNNTGAILPSITSALQSIFQVVVGGYAQVRVTALAGMTGTATVTLRASNAASLVALDAPVPAGTNIIGALSANQSINNAQINGVTPLMGNGVTGTGSQRVTIASDNTAFSVNAIQSGTWNVNNVAGTVSLPTGASTGANQTTINNSITTMSAKLPAALGQTTSGASMAVVIASDQSSVPVSVPASTTSGLSNVSGSASSVTVLASNASRKNATFFNDSTAILYLKLNSGVASTTSYSVQIQPNGYYELPNGSVYTGAITGIWSAANGAVRVTELT